MISPEETVKLVEKESRRLEGFLKALPAEGWSTPSACDRWEVRDVVAHFIIQAQFYKDAISRSLQGDTSAPKGLPPAGSATAASFSEQSAQYTIAMRKKIGDGLLNEFLTTNEQLNQLMESIGPKDWDKTHFFNSLGMAPLKLRPGMRLGELVLHGWDIRSGFAPDIHLSKESMPVLLPLYGDPLLRWIFRPGPKLTSSILYRFKLTDLEGYDRDIFVTGDSARIESESSETASLTCRMAGETFLLIMSGRLFLPDALEQKCLDAEGDMGLINKFSQWFQSV